MLLGQSIPGGVAFGYCAIWLWSPRTVWSTVPRRQLVPSLPRLLQLFSGPWLPKYQPWLFV